MTAMVDVVRSALGAIAWSDLLGFLLRLTALSGIGCVALALAPRASAAVRHRIALATLATCLALPLVTALPAQHVPLLPAAAAVSAASVEPARTPSPRSIEPATDLTARESGSGPSVRRTSIRRGTKAAGPASPVAGYRRSASRTVRSAPVPQAVDWNGPRMLQALLAAVLLVVLLGLARMVRSMLAAHHLTARSIPVADPRLQNAFALAHSALGLARTVLLRQSAQLEVPIVCGLVQHTLLVPMTAATWSRERLTSVLMHELAHVARRDPVSQLIARLATVVFWFHPLIHVLGRHAWLSCEQACDDVVLAHGARPSAYAEDLLAIARQARAQDALHGLAPAFVRRSGLERRLAAILEPQLRRGAASRWTRSGIAAMALVSLAMLGPIRLVPARASLQPDSAPAAEVIRDRNARPAPAKRPAVERVLADRGKPTAKAASNAVDATAPPAESDAPPMASAIVPAIVSAPSSGKADFELATGGSGQDWFRRGRDRYEAEDYAGAASAYMRAAAGGYRTDISFYNAACSWALDDQPEPALTALEAALDAGFDQPDLMASDDDLDVLRDDPQFARLQQRIRHTDKAEAKQRSTVAEYERLVSTRSRNADAWRSVGITLMRSGETSRAVDAFEKQYAIDSSPASIYNKACAQALGGRRSAALGTLERAILAGSGDADHMRRDDDLASLRDDDEFDRLIELSRDLELVFPSGINGRGSWRKALPRFERAVQQHPDAGRAWFNLGYARLAAGDAEGSVEANERALSLGYRVPTTMYNLACGNAQLGETDDAIRWLQRAEGAGLELSQLMSQDDDLDPIRSDPRFQRMRDRWRREAWEQKHSERKGGDAKDDYKDDNEDEDE